MTEMLLSSKRVMPIDLKNLVKTPIVKRK